ncbi:MAG: DUF4358 domain-containing protein [Oscillospiraceae bacterium]|nr:DUF4358 domain-containing protein [Oscillospiraceae bacterium]
MKKRWIAFLLTALCAAGLMSGCGVQAKDVDVAAVADEVKNTIVFQDEMMEIEKDVLENYYRVTDEDIESFQVYKSASGATAEEIAVFQAKSGRADAVKEAVNMRVEDLGLSFEDYVPEEMVKINNAVVLVKGHTVALVVADDSDGAKKLLNSLLS